jgi:hypothetical protein
MLFHGVHCASGFILSLVVSAVYAGDAPKPQTPKDGPLGMKFVPLPKGTTYLGWSRALRTPCSVSSWPSRCCSGLEGRRAEPVNSL